MMKKLFVLVLAVAGLATFAGTCVFQNTKLSEIQDDKVFAGEILNDTGANFLAHDVIVAFLTDDNDIVDTVTVQGCLRSWQNGELAFFAASTDEDVDDIEKTLHRLEDFTVGDVESGDIAIDVDSAARSGDSLTVEGTLTNEEGEDLDDARVCVVVRDENGDVLNVARDNDTIDLDEDADEDFSVTVDVVDDADEVDSVDVWVDALNNGDPTAPQNEDDWDVTVGTPTPGATSTPAPTATPTPNDSARPPVG
jgi:hypothetical protein